MENKKKFIPYLIASLIIHIALAAFLILDNSKPLFLSSAIDVSFYSPSSEMSEIQSFVKDIPAVYPETKQEEVKTRTIETKEPEIVEESNITKEDVIVKAKQEEKVKSETTRQSPASLNKVNSIKKPSKEKRYAAAGSQYSGVAFDTANFQYAFYTNTIVRKISNNWSWSESYNKLRAVVFFRISRDGAVSEISIKDSSGNKSFDNNALNAVKRAGQFAPLPQGYKPDSLGVYFEFKYRS
ncbi:MAG: TonB family protein [Elusimicrobiota bacterium]|jgi:protein TonB|nr:TonB family protein [Elusimicrobiota bacterium]